MSNYNSNIVWKKFNCQYSEWRYLIRAKVTVSISLFFVLHFIVILPFLENPTFGKKNNKE
jgi:hypothetical protein